MELVLEASNGEMRKEKDPTRPEKTILVLDGAALAFVREDALKTLDLSSELYLGTAKAMPPNELVRRIFHYALAAAQ